MPINIGNNRIGEIYVGSTAIGQVYKGSTLVWESGPSLKLYGSTWVYQGNTVYSYVAGSWSTSGLVMKGLVDCEITAITGTLGASGSKITVKLFSNTYTASYSKLKTVSGIKIYIYIYNDGFLNNYFSVMKGSKVGSAALYTLMGEPENPSSVTSTTLVAGGTTYTRDSSKDATWYLSGVK